MIFFSLLRRLHVHISILHFFNLIYFPFSFIYLWSESYFLFSVWYYFRLLTIFLSCEGLGFLLLYIFFSFFSSILDQRIVVVFFVVGLPFVSCKKMYVLFFFNKVRDLVSFQSRYFRSCFVSFFFPSAFVLSSFLTGLPSLRWRRKCMCIIFFLQSTNFCFISLSLF